MAEHGRIVDTPYPGCRSAWPHIIAECGHSSKQSYQDVVYYKRRCQPCTLTENGEKRRARSDAAERQMMIDSSIMPYPDVTFPGTNEPWPSWCLTCGYGKDHGPQWTPRSCSVKRRESSCPHCLGRRSWTHEEATAYIAAFGVTPAEEYPGLTEKLWQVSCSEGHEFTTTFADIRGKQSSRCRDCARNMPHTADEALNAFRALGLEPNPCSQYPGYQNPWPSTCTQCQRRCETVRLSTVLKGSGCRSCNATRAYADPTQLAEELAQWGFSLVEGHHYPGPNKPWPVRHDSCGEVFPRRMAGLRNGFRGCRNCSEQCGGLVRSKPSFVYVLVNVELDAIKVGIAGHTSVYDRIADFESSNWKKYWSMDFDTGYNAEAVERSVHSLLRRETGQTFRRGFLPRSDMPNGHSETYNRDEVPELYARKLIEEQAIIYAEMIQGLQDKAEPGQLAMW